MRRKFKKWTLRGTKNPKTEVVYLSKLETNKARKMWIKTAVLLRKLMSLIFLIEVDQVATCFIRR